jgi:ribosomal protein S18 acetylase RimI-like enzyme
MVIRLVSDLVSTYDSGMTFSELDNPFWSSLQTRHRDIAMCTTEVARFPADYAPFLGVAHAGVNSSDVFSSLLAPGESVYLLGVAPTLNNDWQMKAFRPLAQMICEAPLEVIDGPEIIPLSDEHRTDVLDLTSRIYPHYFRTRTMELGRYFGIYQSGKLAAMIGERLGADAHQEISAVCTDPDFNGRGYARRLLAFLSNDNLQRNRQPFLHVSHENNRALSLYEAMGYRIRRDIPFWSLCQAKARF